MARLRASGRTSLPACQQPRNPQSESIARTPYQPLRHGARCSAVGEHLLGPAELTQRHLPPMLQLCRDQTIVGIDPGELPLRQEGLVAEPLDLLRPGPVEGFFRLPPSVSGPLPGF